MDAVTQEELAEVRSIVHDLANLSCEQGVQIDALSQILADAQPAAAQLVEPVSSRELEGQELLRQGAAPTLRGAAQRERRRSSSPVARAARRRAAQEVHQSRADQLAEHLEWHPHL